MNYIKNNQKTTHYFISLFFLMISIDVLTYILFPVLKNNLAFLLIGIFTIVLDSILLLFIKLGFNWARWTFIISLFMKAGILVSSTLDNLFIVFNFNTKYVILALYFLVICILLFSKRIKQFNNLCSDYRYYVQQCKEYVKSRYNMPISLNNQFALNFFPDNHIVMPVHSPIDNCSFSVMIQNNMIYDDYFERYFNNEINSKIKFEIKKYALKCKDSYATKLLNTHINKDSKSDTLEFNIDSSLNLFGEYKEKVPPYEVFYNLNSSQGSIINFTYSITIDYNDFEFNVKYIYLVLETLKSFNYKFDIINFYDTHAGFSDDETYIEASYVIKEMSYSEACDILNNQDLSYIKEKVDSYITNITQKHENLI